MPYNGQGLFTPKHVWVNEAAQQIPMLPTNFDDQDSDMAAALTNAITRDGQSIPTADIPWGNFGITGLRAPVLGGDAANKKYVDDVDAATRTWVGATTTALPAQTGNAGKALVTDGTQASWQQVYPALTSNSSKLLTNDGTSTSWSANLKASVIRFADGTDGTKLAAFDLSGLTTGTTRNYGLPDASGMLALRTDSAMQLLAQVTVTTPVANIDFLNLFTAAYDKYLIEITNLTFASSTTLQIQLAKAGVVQTTGYYDSVGNTASSWGISSAILNAAGTLAIIGVNDQNGVKNLMANIGIYTPGGNPVAASTLIDRVFYAASTIASGFRISSSAAVNITAGAIRVYGIKNS